MEEHQEQAYLHVLPGPGQDQSLGAMSVHVRVAEVDGLFLCSVLGCSNSLRGMHESLAWSCGQVIMHTEI